MKNDYSFVAVKDTNKGKGVFARKNFKIGEITMPISCDFITTCEKATDMSIQIGEDEFIETKDRCVDDFCNHSCEPNMMVDLDRLVHIAIKNIPRGEELTWNYLTTEYSMDTYLHFKCLCNSFNCIGMIRGYKFLSKNDKQSLTPFLSLYLLSVK